MMFKLTNLTCVLILTSQIPLRYDGLIVFKFHVKNDDHRQLCFELPRPKQNSKFPNPKFTAQYVFD